MKVDEEQPKKAGQQGVLYVIATPIGNFDDITLRALKTLQEIDVLLCEERRIGTTLLKKLNIDQKNLILVNEHSEKEAIAEVLSHLAAGKKLGLISDCGTPVFADPGALVIEQVRKDGYQVQVIPGVSSLMAAFSLLDKKSDQFYYAGFLPRNKDELRKELLRLKTLKIPLVIMDTPYRLAMMLQVVEKSFGSAVHVSLALDLTLPSEAFISGQVTEVIKQVGQRKAEFVLIIHS